MSILKAIVVDSNPIEYAAVEFVIDAEYAVWTPQGEVVRPPRVGDLLKQDGYMLKIILMPV